MRHRTLALSLLLLLPFTIQLARTDVIETVILDSHPTSNDDSAHTISEVHPSPTGFDSGHGQSFQYSTGQYKLTSAQFNLRKTGSPAGDLAAQLYSADVQNVGTAKPDALLAESSTLNMASLPLSPEPRALFQFSFSEPNRPSTSANTVYVIAIIVKSATVLDATNAIQVGMESGSADHAGVLSFYDVNGWTIMSNRDSVFTVSGDLILTGGSGSSSGGGGRGNGDGGEDGQPPPTGPLAGGTLIVVLAAAGIIYWFGVKGKRR